MMSDQSPTAQCRSVAVASFNCYVHQKLRYIHLDWQFLFDIPVPSFRNPLNICSIRGSYTFDFPIFVKFTQLVAMKICT